MHTTRTLNKFSNKMLFVLILIYVQQQEAVKVEESTTNDLSPPPSPPGPASSNITSAMVTMQPPQPPPRFSLRLNKCCHLGEYLNSMQVCVAGNTDRWVPKILLVARKEYYNDTGKHPKFMQFEENVRPVNSGCSEDELELIHSSKVVIFSNGFLYLHELGLQLDSSRYCVDREYALVCLSTENRSKVKLKKCCAKQHIYDAQTTTCVKSDEKGTETLPKLPIDEDVYQTVYGFPECKDKSNSFVIAGNHHEAYLHPETGHLQLPLKKNLSNKDYCLEHIREPNNSMSVKIFACLHHFSNDNVNGSVESNRIQVAALNFGIVISVVFLAATLIASYLMPSVHHVLHWRCQFYYVFCLFVGELILACTELSSSLVVGSPFCLFLASAMHFFFLSAFFWLNTMCFNIWWTFRDFRPSSLERNQELLRLRLYSGYAWGIPLVISVIAAGVNQIPESGFLQPGFGITGCWFSGEHLSIFGYFFAPVGVLLCLNIVLFISTTHQLTCGLWKRDDVKSTTEKTALGKVCLKLVVVMGVTWIADIISWLVGGPHSTWFFTDLINALQGVFIFIVVGCQPQVWSACKRFCCPRSRQEITNTTNGVQHSSSSQGLPSMGNCGAEITQNTSVNMTVASNGASGTQTKIPMETVC